MSTNSKTLECVQPFWERFAEILRYPLQATALSNIAALTIARLVLYLPSFVGGLLNLIVWAAFFKYAFEVLRWSANGRTTAPEISFTMGDEVGRHAVLLIILCELLLVATFLLFGTGASACVAVIFTLAMPAMMTILALDEDLVSAMNPVRWIEISTRLGWPYLILAGFFIAALLIQSVIAGLLASILPGIISLLITYLVVHYVLIVNFHLTGYMIHQYQDVFAYTGHLELQTVETPPNAEQAIVAAAERRASEGDAEGAATLLREELQGNHNSLLLHDQYRHWLRKTGDNAKLLEHGKKYISVLLALDQERRAVDIARECLTLDPQFALAQAEDITRTAHVAADTGQTQVTLGLISGFHKRFRNHPDIARNYLLAARLLAERMNREMQARALLLQIKETLPHDPLIPEVDAYLAFLDKLSATPSAQSKPRASEPGAK